MRLRIPFVATTAASCRRKISFAALLTTTILATTAGSAQAAPPSCSSAQNYAIWQTHNEALFIGGGRGFNMDPYGDWSGSYSDFCNTDPSQNRTYVEVVHRGRNGFGLLESFRMKVYVYPRFTGCGGPVNSLDLGNVDWRYNRSDYVQYGVYATPCE
jgi:hypothetical protein